MIVAQVPGVGDIRANVAVQGSCRVSSPFRSIVAKRRFDVLCSQSTPFTCTPGAARQYFDFCSGRLKVPRFLWPFVFSDPATPLPSRKMTWALGRADLCVVEIATLDQLTSCGFHFHMPSVSFDFVRGQGKAHLRWWREVTDRQLPAASREAVDLLLEERRANGLTTPEVVERFVADMRLETLDEAQLERALAGLIAAGSDKKWLFVSHLNIATTGPAAMQDRLKLLEMLRRVAARLGQAVFDPAPTVETYGFQRALKGGGADKYHYETAFNPVIGEALLEAIENRLFGGSISGSRSGALRWYGQGRHDPPGASVAYR